MKTATLVPRGHWPEPKEADCRDWPVRSKPDATPGAPHVYDHTRVPRNLAAKFRHRGELACAFCIRDLVRPLTVDFAPWLCLSLSLYNQQPVAFPTNQPLYLFARLPIGPRNTACYSCYVCMDVCSMRYVE